mmetsp:Transcript_23543/g.52110  ORF Transcript_23543/g.52110 Transcript_23543/m.52110 type:complete len:882 (+) Transcript_23543:119-2764(+)
METLIHQFASMGPAGEAIEAGVGTAAGVGVGLFNYNRGNFRMDQKMHFSRFTAGQAMAVAQVKQYREDVVDLTALTCTRMDLYHGIGAMSLTILTALFCPGRLGLHTPPPPGWCMGLFLTNLAGCYMYLGMTMWLAMHASLRADSAGTHMLTRFVRLPIPSMTMLDRARKFMANYEEMPMGELLRFPWTRHQRATRRGEGGFNESIEIEPDAEARTRHGYDVPAWYRKEKHVDYGHMVESMMPYNARGSAPEHFEAYREIQNEWWPYDVYSRLSVFLAHMHLMHAWSYHQMGHHFAETRSLFAVVTVVVPLVVIQQIILTLDIVPGHTDIPWHRLGPLAPIFAYFGMYIEYKRWYTTDAAAIGVALVILTYILHIIYTLQLLKICAPSTTPPAPADAPGAAWWPANWRLPAAFQHAVWLVAPPKHLDPDQNDLAGEIRAKAIEVKGEEAYSNQPRAPEKDDKKRRDVHRALGPQKESPAWRNVQIGLIALAVAWIWLLGGYAWEVINQGTTHPSLISAPGLPNNARDPRYRPAKPGKQAPAPGTPRDPRAATGHSVEVGTGANEDGPGLGEKGGHAGRLLAEESQSQSQSQTLEGQVKEQLKELIEGRHELAKKLRELVPQLGGLTGAKRPVAPALSAEPSTLQRLAVKWPALLEPRLVVAGANGEILALSRHGRGALIAEAKTDGAPIEALPFALEGASGAGPLLSASWDSQGLLLLTTAGATMQCPGSGPTAGRWKCKELEGPRLPLSEGSFEGAAALARGPQVDAAAPVTLRAAVAFPLESTITLFSRSGSGPWRPTGEVGISIEVTTASYAGDDLLLTSRGGDLWKVGETGRAKQLKAATSGATWWQSTCKLGERLVHLTLEPAGTAMWEPMLLLGS